MSGVSSRRLALHEAHALLGVGAGIGLTTERLLSRGWKVTAIEPNAIMRGVLEKRLAIRAYPDTFETFDDPEPYDAVIAESVFYRFNLEQAFARVHRLLRLDGRFALNDMVWTDAAQPEAVPAVAAETERVFGIPATSVEPLTWASWKRMLAAAGFVELAAERIGAVKRVRGQRRTMLLNGVRHPLALARCLWYRGASSRGSTIPPDWLESWMSVWRRA